MDELGPVVDEVQLVLNTTSAGMHPHVDELPLPLELLRSHHLVSDLIYNPRITRFLREAEAKEEPAFMADSVCLFIKVLLPLNIGLASLRPLRR